MSGENRNEIGWTRFIAPHYIDAVRRLGNVEVIAIAGSNDESAKRKVHQLGVAKSYGSSGSLNFDWKAIWVFSGSASLIVLLLFLLTFSDKRADADVSLPSAEQATLQIEH